MRVQRVYAEVDKDKDDNSIDLCLLNPLIEKFRGQKGSIIPLLQGAQAIYGYIPAAAFKKISEETGVSLSDMYGVATFYAQFRLKPAGKHIIKVCHGTACHVQNADAITDAIKEALNVKDGETTPDRLFTLESVACLGCCSLAPVMMIGEETYGKLTGASAVKVIKDIKIKELER
ncbi:MAG: NADH-quinone oxidoreductase subunit NuoE [Tenuifilaceae bacterium]|jgi:NADH-quinone oxidoreductase subunit E|uniref:NADH-quinone oxidoreductase subunit NuoE n=1 Tax=Perlabentimonas gracilis TaxID=2715279 RepID=UPI0014096B4F|nr:NADH-quinone oxidoreductase subunit NuoE [Perlabentimonas gracilis]MDX9770592.1 NADH-quinone oxidoreductase subunit NuoE [Tenuifilaceae bacterium]NHB68240.1 NADH-quinone oxidoreductase subunit NuoE [Perlabentimonas gracilis]